MQTLRRQSEINDLARRFSTTRCRVGPGVETRGSGRPSTGSVLERFHCDCGPPNKSSPERLYWRPGFRAKEIKPSGAGVVLQPVEDGGSWDQPRSRMVLDLCAA